jgi:HK97 family phage major capsid protein
MNIAALEADLARVKAQALTLYKSTATTAEAENRAFTDEELAALRAKKDEGLAIEAKIARIKGDAAVLAEIERLAASASADLTPSVAQRRAQSWGQMFANSAAMEFLRQGGHKTQSQWRTPSLELPWQRGSGGMPSLRAATLTEGVGSGGAWVLPDYQPGVVMPLPAPFLVSELFAQGTTESNVIAYMRETAFVNTAAPVLEGGLKPESTLTFEQASDPVRKIAHWLPVTEELLEDAPAIASYIDARLRMGVLQAEQNQLINGDGTAPNLSGILDRVGLAPDIARDTVATPPQANHDVFLEQTMAIYASSFLMADGYVINPLNWSAILLAKTATGEYFAGGPFSPIQTPTLWGLPVALTPAIAAGTGLVGAFKTGAQIFRKGGVRVEASNSHSDYFIKNLVAIRAEERLALAVYRPGAFGTVSGLA